MKSVFTQVTNQTEGRALEEVIGPSKSNLNALHHNWQIGEDPSILANAFYVRFCIQRYQICTIPF